MSTPPFLGVCYYPEHWPEAMWAHDARRMADIGLKEVRIAEFAWAKMEPAPGRFEWDWLDRAVDRLAEADLHVMMCTPTATPPKWLVDASPDILAWDANGRPRRFGSRRHYCFSSPVYREETIRIVTAIAERYGGHEAVSAWQTDNEYGCHNTTRSYSPSAAAAFRDWLKTRYGSIDALNEAWGTIFWSQTYGDFAAVDLPNMLVTEANPAHLMDFYRFSSDQVIAYNHLQTDILRRLSPGRRIVHNAMGFYTEFDHFRLGQDLDAIGWDSYPLGFTDLAPLPADLKSRYMRQGHPDISAFHHDLYRRCGGGAFRVSEQQPGPVNWAPHNPAPRPGMVRLWAVEAAAHGAEAVSYFRWRQAPFAQEQMHAGLLRPDDRPAPAYNEAKNAAADFTQLGAETKPARVALVYSYEAVWAFEAERQGATWSYPALVMEWYAVARRLGMDIDIAAPGDDLAAYDLVLCPSLPILDGAAVKAFSATAATIVFGPRTGVKTAAFQIPENLPPGPLQALIPLKITRSESFPPDHREHGVFGGTPVQTRAWLDHIETDLPMVVVTDDGNGLLYRHENFFWLAGVPEPEFLGLIIANALIARDVAPTLLPEDLRVRRRGELAFAFNYGPNAMSLPDGLCPAEADFQSGGRTLPPAGFAIWRES